MATSLLDDTDSEMFSGNMVRLSVSAIRHGVIVQSSRHFSVDNLRAR
jgi:hypothetical protein